MSGEEQYEEVNFFEIMRILKKHLSLLMVLFLLFTLSAGIVTYFFIPDQYQSSMTFYLKESGDVFSGRTTLSDQLKELNDLITELSSQSRKAEAELCGDIIRSRRLLGEVLSEQGLPAGPEDINRFRRVVAVEVKKSGALEVRVKWTDPQTAYELTEKIFNKFKEIFVGEIKEFDEDYRFQMIDPPVAPHKKHSPSVAMNMVVAGVFALFIGVFWVFLREAIDNYRAGTSI